MKKKTPLDLARDGFAENTKLLNPSSNQVAVLSSNLSRREDKTCTWIFQLEEYKSWTESADRGLTWVSGAGGKLKVHRLDIILTYCRIWQINSGVYRCGSPREGVQQKLQHPCPLLLLPYW